MARSFFGHIQEKESYSGFFHEPQVTTWCHPSTIKCFNVISPSQGEKLSPTLWCVGLKCLGS